MTSWYSRTELLLGKEQYHLLQKSKILIAGLGGVGGFAAEMLCRAGIGNMTIIDSDTVHPSNRNRQIIALKSTEHMLKTDVCAKRLKDINPSIHLKVINKYLIDDAIPHALEGDYDYVIDAIDTLSPKTFFIHECMKKELRLISSMGAGGKTDPSQITISDISKSHNCRLGYYLRKHLHKLGVYSGFKVVFSPEPIHKSAIIHEKQKNKNTITGTISYMPAVFGCYIAAEVVRDIVKE